MSLVISPNAFRCITRYSRAISTRTITNSTRPESGPLSPAGRHLPAGVTVRTSPTGPAGRNTNKRPRRQATADNDGLDGLNTGNTLETFNLQSANPGSAIDSCSSTGFVLAGSVAVPDTGVCILAGETFKWRPAGLTAAADDDVAPATAAAIPGPESVLARDKAGRWAIPEASLGVLDLVWPKPDLVVFGTGAVSVPLAPAVSAHLNRLGIRAEVCDSRNAAAHFNVLVAERGPEAVAALLAPAGLR